MTDMKDPVRLQIGGSSEVKELLRSASADAPSRTQLDLLAARLAPVVTAAPVTTTASLGPWIVAGIAIVGSAAVIFSTRDRGPVPPSPSPPPAYVAPAPIVTPAEPPSPPAAAPVVVEAAVEAPRAATARPRPRASESPVAQAKPASVEQPAARPKEIELLDAAHRALSTGAAQRALDLVDEHAELYATGSLIEEREAIAIEALHRLGRDEQAGTRFRNFVVSFPRSGYRARLEHLLEKQP